MCLRVIMLCAAMVLSGCASNDHLPPRPPITEDAHLDTTTFPGVAHFIDVNQGDATLLEFPCGVILIDAGGDGDEDVQRLVEYLDAVFDRRPDLNRTLDLVLITHAHIDHTRGLDALRGSFTIRRYIDGGRDTGSGIAPIRRFKQAAANEQIAVRKIVDDDIAALPHRRGLTDDFIDPLRCDACDPRLTILAASHENGSGLFSNENYHSLVVRIDLGESSLLITGDLETQGIKHLLSRYRGTDMLDVDVYHAGHHGQRDGTTPELAAAMSPQLAVISCGDCEPTLDPISAYAFGNPRKSIIEMLSEYVERDRAEPLTAKVAPAARWFNDHRIQRAIYCTAWDGDIIIGMGADGTLRVVNDEERNLE